MDNGQYLTKITNKDLEQLIVCSINAKESTFLPTVYERAWLEALKYKELEIEGYERSQWVKFDPNDPKTIPPKNTVVLLTIQGLPLEDNICTWHTNLQERHNARGLPGVFTHWRPLPNPPVEQEANREA